MLGSLQLSTVDPWFNFRATKYLVQHGFYSFWDWFDDRAYHQKSESYQENGSMKWTFFSGRFLRLTASIFRNMASTGKGHWRDAVPGLDGNERCNLPSTTTAFDAHRYTKHMRTVGPRVLWPDCRGFLSHHVRDDNVPVCRTFGGGLHGHHAWIHLEIRGG